MTQNVIIANASRIALILMLLNSNSTMFNGAFAQNINVVRTPEEIVRQTIETALARCYSSIDGIKRITVIPPTDDELDRIESLGDSAVAPLSAYIDLSQKGGLMQWFAVQFLTAIASPSAEAPLIRALEKDQWDVTRASALNGLYKISADAAKPHIRSALTDKSPVVRLRAEELMKSYANEKP